MLVLVCVFFPCIEKLVNFVPFANDNTKCHNTVVSNHVNSDHVPSFSCLDV